MVNRHLRRSTLVGICIQAITLNLSAQTVVSGTVRAAGAAPATAVPDMSSDAWCADNAGTVTPAVGSNGGVREVLVYAVGVPASTGGSEPVVLDQSGCWYRPAVIGLHTGQELVIRNSDETLHNVHVLPQANRGFNIGQPLKGLQSRRSFNTPEQAIPVKCDIHGWMSGHIFVFDHPYFAVTNSDGQFSLPALPAGNWTLRAWHPTLGTGDVLVTTDGGPATVEITLRP